MRELEREVPGSVANDLSDMEDRVEFAPGGIDDPGGPGVALAARHLRIVGGLQQDDLLFGHFSSVLDHPKRLWDTIKVFVRYASSVDDATVNNRRLYFVLSGKIVDIDLFHRIRYLFQGSKLSSRLLYSNPALEPVFDAENPPLAMPYSVSASKTAALCSMSSRGHYQKGSSASLSTSAAVMASTRE